MAPVVNITSSPTDWVHKSAKRTREVFAADFGFPQPSIAPTVASALVNHDRRAGISARMREYADVVDLPPRLAAIQANNAPNRRKKPTTDQQLHNTQPPSNALALRANGASEGPHRLIQQKILPPSSLVHRNIPLLHDSMWKAPWKPFKVLSDHLGWVRALAVDPINQWFASGAADNTIKIWDLASGTLKVTLTGHISTVRGLAVSSRHPYLFSCGEDKQVKCWDVETNKVIREYHGHLSGIHALDIHPTLDFLCTGGRDGVVRVWDMRTLSNIHVLSGHTHTVSSVKCQEADPQVMSSSSDGTVRMWDLAAGNTMGVLTHHKKGVRTLATHPTEFTFASASTGQIKQWKCPEGALLQNFDGHNAVINTLSVNTDNVMFSGSDDGSYVFWDWKTGSRYHHGELIPQPGSLDAEASIYCSTFDRTGLRLIVGAADESIQMYKQDKNAARGT